MGDMLLCQSGGQGLVDVLLDSGVVGLEDREELNLIDGSASIFVKMLEKSFGERLQ
jgi:hypothetical protein